MSELLTIRPQKKKEAEISVNLHPVTNRIHKALTTLHALKSHRFTKYWKFREEYAMRTTKERTEDGYTSYHTNTWFALVNTKIADVISNTPKYDFIALDTEAKKYKRVKELFWKYVWTESHTDIAIMQIVFDALKYWVGFWEEIILNKKRKVKVPYYIEGEMRYIEKEITEYYGSKLNYVPWSQVYLNGSNIENTTEAIVISYWDRDEFLMTYWNNPQFSWVNDEDIPKGKYYYVGTWSNLLTVNGSPSATDRGASTIENDKIVSVLTYYNKYRDEYIVLANDKWINPINTLDSAWAPQENIQPIPYPHKEIPIVVYTDHIIEDDIYGLWELDITENSREFKDDLRSTHIEGIKAQWWIITIGQDADFDETVMKLWMRQVARVDPESFGFFAPTVNLQSLAALEKQADEDIIVESWVDFKSQLLWVNETARRTEGRIDASKKRINHNIKHNAYTFYERLARLRSANFEFCYWDKGSQLPTKGLEVSSEWTIEYVQNGYGLFTMKPEYFKWKLALIPVVDSLYGDTSNESKTKYIETLQLLMNMKNPDGTPTFDSKLLIEAWRGIIDEVIDLDKVLGKSNDSKTPEDIMKDAGIGWTSQVPPSPDAQWVPPAQQSWAPILLGSSAKPQ